MAAYLPEDILIYGAFRTPIGDLNGALASLKAHELGAVVIKKLLETSQISGEDVSEVILGHVLTAGQLSFLLLFHSVIKEPKSK